MGANSINIDGKAVREVAVNGTTIWTNAFKVPTDFKFSELTWSYIPPLDLSLQTNLVQFFAGCTDIKEVKAIYNTGNMRTTKMMFIACRNLITAPVFDTVNVIEMYQMFAHCTSLVSVPMLDATSATNLTQIFFVCPALETCCVKNLRVDISFSDSPDLSADSVAFIVANAANADPISITLHATAYDRAIADPGVQVALASNPSVTLASA